MSHPRRKPRGVTGRSWGKAGGFAFGLGAVDIGKGAIPDGGGI